MGTMVLAVILLAGCSQPNPVNLQDPLESARGFIEASLKGNFDRAQQYLLNDSTNRLYFDGYKEFSAKQSDAEREGYRQADIIIDSLHQVSDSVTVVTYANTFKKKTSKLKMVRVGKDWFVDFKFTFLNQPE